MKTTPAIAIALLHFATVNAQPAPDMQAQQDYFYATDGNTVHQYTLTGGSVTDQGACTTPYSGGNLYGLAYGYDITNYSTNRTLYASSFTGNMGSVLRWSGTQWDVIYTDNYYYLNGGAHGEYIYFIRYDFSVTPNKQAIMRLMNDGSLVKIFESNNLEFTVADLAVDSNGYIYCFRGPSVGNTNQMNIISPQGALVGTYVTTLGYQLGFYGSMFMDGTLYLGIDVGTPALVPVTWSSTTASLGLPVFNSYSMTDLANAHGFNSTTAVHDFIPEQTVSATMTGNHLVIDKGNTSQAHALVTDAAGKLVIMEQLYQKQTQLNLNILNTGVYFVQIISGQNRLLTKTIYSK